MEGEWRGCRGEVRDLPCILYLGSVTGVGLAVASNRSARSNSLSATMFFFPHTVD